MQTRFFQINDNILLRQMTAYEFYNCNRMKPELRELTWLFVISIELNAFLDLIFENTCVQMLRILKLFFIPFSSVAVLLFPVISIYFTFVCGIFTFKLYRVSKHFSSIEFVVV